MKNILTKGIKTCIHSIIYLLTLTCFGQETSFLNKFQFSIKDTVAHQACYYQNKFSYPDSTLVKVYTLDSLLVKEEVHLLNEKKEIYRRVFEYDSLGNVKSFREKDMIANTEYFVGFHPDGQLKSRHHYFNNIRLSEEYFDSNGNAIDKSDEELPAPKGGMTAWNQYLANNLHYPRVARRKGQEGTVYLWFQVDEEGNIQNLQIMNPEQVSPILAEEALRVVKKYPHRWSPGKKNGIPNSVAMRMPINFEL